MLSSRQFLNDKSTLTNMINGAHDNHLQTIDGKVRIQKDIYIYLGYTRIRKKGKVVHALDHATSSRDINLLWRRRMRSCQQLIRS